MKHIISLKTSGSTSLISTRFYARKTENEKHSNRTKSLNNFHGFKLWWEKGLYRLKANMNGNSLCLISLEQPPLPSYAPPLSSQIQEQDNCSFDFLLFHMSKTLTQDWWSAWDRVSLLYLECFRTTSPCSQKVSVQRTVLHFNNTTGKINLVSNWEIIWIQSPS